LIKTNLGLEFLKKLLLIKNNENSNFYQVIHLSKQLNNDVSLMVLDILFEIVGDDKEFFISLTKQEEIPDKIKEFLEENLKVKL
jgi:hypothetical protein